MPIKIFTTIDGPCPFGTGHAIDSPGCRKCQHFYRTGTATFFWCSHPVEPEKKKPEKPKESPVVIKEQPKKRGRPKKTELAKQKKKRGTTPKKGKERPIKTIKQVTK